MKRYRTGLEPRDKTVVFFLNNGGIGDYLCFMSALKYVAETNPHVKGEVLAPNYMFDIVENILGPFGWKVFNREIRREYDKSIEAKGVMLLPLNATMGHLMDIGFVYYAETMNPPEEAKYYCELDFSNVEDKGWDLGDNYAIMTPGATTNSRTMRPDTFNFIKDYLILKGLKPVFLGSLGGESGTVAHFHKDYDLKGGVNLINKTSLLEAAKVIDGAKLVVGLDNGLLHLAAMTKCPIVFGYSMTGPRQRRPKRKNNSPIIDVTISEKELECIHCQEKMRFTRQDFGFCFYNDYRCLELLNFDKFKVGIDEVLNA